MPVFAVKYLYGIVPSAGIVNSSSISKTASGVPIDQPSANVGVAGMSLSSPFGAPASTHAAIVSISCFVNRGSFLNIPCGVSAPHGGIVPETTRCLIDLAHGRAASKVVSDIGANIVGRWHSTQALLKIGATSFANVGAVLPSAANAAAGMASITVKMSFLMSPIVT